MSFLSPNQQCQSSEWIGIAFHGLAYPKLIWGLSTLFLITKGSWLPLVQVRCGRVPDRERERLRAGSNLKILGWPGLLHTKVYSAFHPSGVGKWVPAAAGKAKAGMAHSDCVWTCGCAGKTVKSLENTCHTRALLGWWFTTKRLYHVYAPLPSISPLMPVPHIMFYVVLSVIN